LAVGRGLALRRRFPAAYAEGSPAPGASRRQILIRVRIPAALSGIIAAIMLGMGRAIDEPCSVLDPVAKARIEDLIEELKKLYTVVIVTHNMQQAARVSDDTAFMMLGELMEFDRTDKIFTNPANTLTEEYITGRFG